MIPWERLRRFVSSAPPPRSKWARDGAAKEVVLPNQSILLKLRGFVGVFLVINVCIGGYLIAKSTPKSSKKQRGQKKEAVTSDPGETRPVRVPHRKVTSNEQRQLFQWMLEEKRKIKPANSTEKVRVDEDKKVLKQFLRATNLPRI